MQVVIMILVILLISALLPAPKELYKLSGEDKTKEKRCPQHKWEYNVNGFLQCAWCNNFPGYRPRE